MEQRSGSSSTTPKLAQESTNPAASRSLPALPSTEQLSTHDENSSPLKATQRTQFSGVSQPSDPETSRQDEINIPKNRREPPRDLNLGHYPTTKPRDSPIPLRAFPASSIPTSITESPTGSPARRIRVTNDPNIYENAPSNQAMDDHTELPYSRNGRIPQKRIRTGFGQYFRLLVVQTYRHLMFLLPSFYFNRVGRVFMEAELTQREVTAMTRPGNMPKQEDLDSNVIHRRGSWRGSERVDIPEDNGSKPSLARDLRRINDHSEVDILNVGDDMERIRGFISSWNIFTARLTDEWRTLNIVSALLLAAIFTFFQIQDAAFVPVTRTFALLSLVSAFFSLLFGNLNIIRFGTAPPPRAASTWAKEILRESVRETVDIFWNIWVLLSLPFVWLAYSLIFFCVALMSFIWTSGTGKYTGPPNPPISDRDAVILVPRIAVTVLFGLGTIYLGLIIKTFTMASRTSALIQ